MYVDPSGHFSDDEIEEYLKATYGDRWEKFLKAWKSDSLFWNMLLEAEVWDTLVSPTTDLPMGNFVPSDGKPFSFEADGLGLESYQGYGPYVLIRKNNIAYTSPAYDFSNNHTESWLGGTGWRQPIYDYSSGEPVFTNTVREVRFDPVMNGDNWKPDWLGGSGIPYMITGGGGAILKFWGPQLFGSAAGPAGIVLMTIGALGYISNSLIRFDAPMSVNIIPVNPNIPSLPLIPTTFPGIQFP